MSEVIRPDPDDLTIGDLEDFEDIAGKPWDEFQLDMQRQQREIAKRNAERQEKGEEPDPLDQPTMPMKTLKAIVFIAKRKADPAFTLEQARQVKIAALDLEEGEQDPTPADGETNA